MCKFKEKSLIIITLITLLFVPVTTYATQTNTNNSVNTTVTNEENNNEEGSATTIKKIFEEQKQKIEKYKVDYGSDTYGIVAYILHLIQWYSIPLGIVGIAFCAIYQYTIGLKRLDIRDKGFNTMIAMITIIIICQILPLIFAVVVKSTV